MQPETDNRLAPYLGNIEGPFKTHRRARDGEYYHDHAFECPAPMRVELVDFALESLIQKEGLLVDPMCGGGTTLVQGLKQGYRVHGVELEFQWAEVARESCRLTTEALCLEEGRYHVDTADARLTPLPPCTGVVCSIPFGPTSHSPGKSAMQAAINRERHIWHGHSHGHTPGNLSSPQFFKYPGFLRGIGDVFYHVSQALDGHMVIHVRPFYLDGRLTNLPGDVVLLTRPYGFRYLGHYTSQAPPSYYRNLHLNRRGLPLIKYDYLLWFEHAR